jgi:hypothetical protein
MNNLLATASVDLPPIGTSTVEARVSDHIYHFLAGLLPQSRAGERRRNMRYPYPCLIRLTPVDDDNATPLDEPITVVGKSISARGIAFYHQNPLPFRRAILTLGDAPEKGLSVVAELLWCRFMRQGWYDSGGRLVAICDDARAGNGLVASGTV